MLILHWSVEGIRQQSSPRACPKPRRPLEGPGLQTLTRPGAVSAEAQVPLLKLRPKAKISPSNPHFCKWSGSWMQGLYYYE